MTPTTAPRTRTIILTPEQAKNQQHVTLLVVPVKPQPPAMFCEGDVAAITNGNRWAFSRVYSPGRGVAWPADPEPGILPPFRVGDRLIGKEPMLYTGDLAYTDGVIFSYEADCHDVELTRSVRMRCTAKLLPEFFARFRRMVLSVTVKRVQDITEDEARCLGLDTFQIAGERHVTYRDYFNGGMPDPFEWYTRATDSFRTYWDRARAHPALPWSTNPWVWLLGLSPATA